ncbi:MAG: arginase [Chloroflexi bacterium AL-W]|nr:arginase [Chloroflexi bacterium AL-N1]NOK69972.1 arginase [Chloroflexi bacterium AL-N10]NOK73730.1 arginase [Chloroflexi bacterium AL-N5]NOK85504.1 arginase [Chloroflexi bacterium AL-W]NOK91705.1 arginase [Chloroflexi bacterium AL-N15]
MHDIAIIGVPIDLGAGRRGVDMGPSAIRYAGLKDRLEQIGCNVRDLGNITVPLAEQFTPPEPDTKLRYLEPLITINTTLADQVATIVQEGVFPLILGGDHSLSIGSVNGVAQGRRIGVIWVDAHGDFNTPETTPSGNIHGMGVAALTGRGHSALSALRQRSPVIREENMALVGIRDLDPLERAALQATGIHVFTMHDIDRRGFAAVMEEAIMRASVGTAGFHVSLDLDALDPSEAPGVGTPVLGGISYREAHLAMELVSESKQLLGMDLVEVNPILDNRNVTATLAVDFALSALGKRIL